MDKQHLIEKKVQYETLRLDIENKSYENEIEAELKLERAKLEAKYAKQKQEDLTKVNHYVELLDVLIADAAKEEALKLIADVEDVEDVEQKEITE